jgi:hypothetical protein
MLLIVFVEGFKVVKECYISCVGQEFFLKMVIQAIPVHSMSCFKLTKEVCKQLRAFIAKYWWSSSLDHNSLHSVSWEVLISLKIKGDMGCRDLDLFNLALLGKHCWHLLMNPDTLCAKVLKGRYFPNSDFLYALVENRAFVWSCKRL